MKLRLLLMTILGLTAALALFVMNPSPGAAQVQTFTMDKAATLSNGNKDVTMTGTFQCPVGETAFVDAQAIQGHGRLLADAAGNVGPILCTGALQTWSVTTGSNRFGAA